MLVVSVVTILLVWLACAIVFIGIGSLALRLCGGFPKIFYAHWVGFGAVVALLEIWNLFLPVHADVSIGLAGIALCGILANRGVLWRELQRVRITFGWAFLVWVALIAYIALRAAGPCNHYDTGLYAAAAVRWITTFPAVPGLANLYGRFGFDSSLFQLVAALQAATSSTLAFRLATGFSLAALWTSIFPSCIRVVRNGSARLADWYFAILTVPTLIWATRDQIAGISTDEPAAAACLLGAGILFADLVAQSDDDVSPAESRTRTIAWSTLFFVAIVLKESTIVFAALAWMIAFLLYFRSRAKKNGRLAPVVPALLIVVPWLARNIILSGYPFFPSTILGIHTSWSVEPAVAAFYANTVHAYARNPVPFVHFASTEGIRWVSAWLSSEVHDRGGLQVPVIISIAGALVTWAFGRNRLDRRQVVGAWLLAASIPGMIFWFLEAPDPRFGEAPIWATAAVLGALGTITALKRFTWVRPRLAVTGFAAVTLWCLFSFGWQMSYRPSLSVHALEPLPAPALAARRTISGLRVYVPTEGEQCWNAPLPCTPYFVPSLRLRSPGNVRWGFSAQGLPEWPPH